MQNPYTERTEYQITVNNKNIDKIFAMNDAEARASFATFVNSQIDIANNEGIHLGGTQFEMFKINKNGVTVRIATVNVEKRKPDSKLKWRQ